MTSAMNLKMQSDNNSKKTGKKLLDVLQGQKTKTPPFWLMRQAGRYLPEYLELRAEAGSFLDLVYNPEFAAEVTLQPIRRFGMDAAILFSDILVIPHALGQHVEFVKGEGPKLNPLSSAEDLKILEQDKIHEILAPIYQTIKNIKSAFVHENLGQTSLIGFAGSPWTVACYMVEGSGSKDFAKTKNWAYSDPNGFDQLIDILVQATASYLIHQIEAGAEVVKLFDSWAGILDEALFERLVIVPTQKIINLVKTEYPDVPVIAFARGAGIQHLNYARHSGASAIAIDQMTPLVWAAENIQPILPVQGNLDPFCLLAGGDTLDRSIKNILDVLQDGPFIFNLGHGIHKDTPPAHVEQLSRIIQNY